MHLWCLLKNSRLIALTRHIIITTTLFLIVDGVLSPFFDFSAAVVPTAPSILEQYPEGFYELKKNLRTVDSWGGVTYELRTDALGFRTSSDVSTPERASAIFLGDSFTFGIAGPAEKQFPWIWAKRTGDKIVNAGVASYSPTVYLHQYKKALQANVLSDPHVVIVGLDLSDVQDESSYWRDGPSHPTRTSAGQHACDGELHSDFIIKHLKLTNAIIELCRRFVVSKLYAPQNVLDRRRSAFTWDDWKMLDSSTPCEGGGYLPLGVQGGLDRIAQQVKQIADVARSAGGRVFILIYPWPGLLTHTERFSWEGYVSRLCADVECQVVNAIPAFRKRKSESRFWYSELYVRGDVHLSEEGNRLVADELARVVHVPAVVSGVAATNP